MKFGQPLLTTELSGSIGGATASSAHGSVNYFRVRRRPSNPRSFLQTTVRNILASLAATWRGTLNDTQRANWTALASDNESGIDVYVKANAPAMLGGLASNPTAPPTVTLPTTPQLSVSVDASAHSVALGVQTVADQYCNVFVSKTQRTSRLSQQFSFSFVGTINPEGQTINIPVGHPAYALTAGEIVYVKIAMWSTEAQVAIPQTFRVIVTA